MKIGGILWEPPEEPGPEVTAVSINGRVYERYPSREFGVVSMWAPNICAERLCWLELVGRAVWHSVAILDATPHTGEEAAP